MGTQLRLFGPNLNVTARLKAAMREAIRKGNLSREEIVDRMRELAKGEGLGGGRGSTISVPNLDAWCSETKANLIPTNLLTLFCFVTRDIAALKVLAAPLGTDIIDQAEQNLLAWAKIEVKAKQLAKQRKRIMSEIKEFSDE
jgi:hypothetical protein